MVAPKKRITTDLLHLALVITLLRGNTQRIRFNDNIISSNFFNDIDNQVDIDNILVEGSNWAFTRTNYHQQRYGRYIDPGIQQAKYLRGSISPNSENEFDWSMEDIDEMDLDEEVYRQQSRLLMLSHLNAAYVRKDPIQHFRDITAYLVSDTTNVNLPNSLASLPIVPPTSSSGATDQNGGSSPAQSTDSGNDSGDEGPSARNSISEPDEIDLDLAQDKNTEFLLEFLENQSAEETGMEVDNEAPGALSASSNNNEAKIEDGLDLEVDVNRIDANEFINFIINNRQNPEELGAAALPPPSSEPATTLEELQRDVYDQSLVSELFDLDQFALSEGERQDEMDWTLVEEEAHLEFYRNFNDAANEVMHSVPIQEIEGGIVPNSSKDSEAATGEDNKEATSDPEETTLLDDVIDDWLETDSGVCDFLDSPAALSEGRSFDFDNLDSVESVDPVEEEDIDGAPSGQDPVSEESTNEMIQAASMHANGRPTHLSTQSRGYQVHARMQGLLRGGSMDQRWQDVVTLLNLQQATPHEGSAGTLPPGLSHAFGPHPHLHHGPPSLHHHFPSPSPATPYTTDSARSVLLQNATLPPPDITSPYANMGPPPTTGSVVASSVHLTSNGDPMIDPSPHYKMADASHDIIYYPNATSNTEMNNQSTEGFLSSILNEDELQIMDMVAMNEAMHSMRLMDYGNQAGNPSSLESLSHGPHQSLPPHGSSNGLPPTVGMSSSEDRMEASSDSAVSSMGSERVHPMTDPSDNDWVDHDSHPHGSHESSPYSMDYAGAKGRSYEYYGKDRVAAPVAQKKHHMFGKRFQQEQSGSSSSYSLPPHHPGLPLPYPTSSGIHPSGLDPLDHMKYGCGVDFTRQTDLHRENGGLRLEPVHNNHTYALPPTHTDNPLTTFKAPKAPAKDKTKNESLSRDEKKARALNLPISTDDIINLPMDEFNERLSKYDLTEPQFSLIRDIRRRGKNKVAAQNCRKRKLDQIMQLADEVQRIKERKQLLVREQQELLSRQRDLMERYNAMYQHISPALRDPDGTTYTLQQAQDGNMILVPRNVQDNIAPVVPSRRDKSSKDDYNRKGE